MLNITHHKRNTNQNNNEIQTSNLSERVKLTTEETTDVGEDAEKGKPSYTIGGMKTGAATLRNGIEVPQKVKNRTTLQPSNCTF